MAEMTSIGFRPGTSHLHRLDPRVKLAALVLVGLTAAGAEPAGLGLLSMLTLAGLLNARLSLLRIAVETRPLLIMLAVAAILRALVVAGDALPGLEMLPVSRRGIFEGLIFAWRVLIVAAGGILLTTTTRTWALRAAVAWFLKPLPGVPAERVATMMGLVVRFIPEILQQAAEVRDAQRARGIEACRNPVRRLACLATVLMRRTLLRADRLAMAMESRAYTENRSDPPLVARATDAAMLAIITAVCLAVLECAAH